MFIIYLETWICTFSPKKCIVWQLPVSFGLVLCFRGCFKVWICSNLFYFCCLLFSLINKWFVFSWSILFLFIHHGHKMFTNTHNFCWSFKDVKMSVMLLSIYAFSEKLCTCIFQFLCFLDAQKNCFVHLTIAHYVQNP